MSDKPAGALYHEPARTYASSWGLLALLLVGVGVDAALGSADEHALAWVIAVVAVVGLDVLAVRTARGLRSVTVTADEIRVGEQSLPRAEVAVYDQDFEPDAHVLGRQPGEGLPRGTVGIAAHLLDGGVAVIPTRHPQQLAAALQVVAAAPEVRPAAAEEIAALPEVEARSFALFTVSRHEPPSVHSAEQLAQAKAVFVAGSPPVGFVAVNQSDGEARVEALSVLPGHMREGIGSALLEAACRWAAEAGYPVITVRGVSDVPWHGPFLAARGFAASPAGELRRRLP